MITIELPDGEQVDIDTDDEARAVEAARRYWRSKPKRQEEQQPEQSALMSGLEYAGNLGMEVLSGAGRGLVGGAEYILGLDPESQRRDAMWREKLTGIKSTVKVPSLASDVLPQKGEFAGEGLATDIAAMAGEYAAPAGALGRVVGKAPAIAEAVTGALSGVGAAVGGEVGESIGGETGRTVGEIAGGMIAPMSMDNYIPSIALTGSLFAKPPNVVVFLVDDMGWGDLGCYGHPIIKSPNLDKFATEGVRFTQCYSACGVCSPSRASILTGRTPYRNGVWRWLPVSWGRSRRWRPANISAPTTAPFSCATGVA